MEYTRNNDYPQNGDKLFLPIPAEGKWLPSGMEDIFKISEGYRMSACSLYQEIKKSEWINKQYLSCTMIFAFRQFLEVRLKELIYAGKRELFNEPNFKTTHNLEALFRSYIDEVLLKIYPDFDRDMVSIVNRLIHEFNVIDPKSMSFRYPVDTNMHPSFSMQNFDIDNFKVVMDRLSNFFDWQLEIVQELENYNSEMASEYASYFSGY